MGEDTAALLERADVAWRTNGFSDTNTLFGYRRDRLLNVGIDDWLMLLMRIMIMEYNFILFERRYRLQWGLKEALSALRAIELTPPPRAGEPFTNDFHHSFYLATHIVYVQSAYNAIKADQREIPWLYRYVRASFRYWMRQVKAQRTDPTTYVDIDGIAEICDCLRGCGMTEASDPMLCEGTLYMLRCAAYSILLQQRHTRALHILLSRTNLCLAAEHAHSPAHSICCGAHAAPTALPRMRVAAARAAHCVPCVTCIPPTGHTTRVRALGSAAHSARMASGLR